MKKIALSAALGLAIVLILVMPFTSFSADAPINGGDGSTPPPTDGGQVIPAISLNPTSGAPGDTVNVTGTGFTPGTSVTISWDGATISQEAAADGGTPVGPDGAFTTGFTIPNALPGSHTVSARDSSGKQASAAFNVKIIPAIVLKPSSGTPGGIITIAGTGFTPYATIDIYWDKTIPSEISLTTIKPTVGPDGSFTTTFTIPKAGAGSHTITARDSSGVEGSATFTVTPALTLKPASGAAGDIITIEGNGFTPSSPVTIIWDEASPVDAQLSAIKPTVGTDGSFTMSYTIPKAAAGSHTITARDSAGIEASAAFTVKPVSIASIAIIPSAGFPGDLVTITGSGFTLSSTINILWDTAAISPATADVYQSGAKLTPDSTLGTGTDGSFTVGFAIPKAIPGSHTIAVRDSSGKEASAPFEVKPVEEKEGEKGIMPIITLSPISGLAGDAVSITGIGFTPQTGIAIFWDGLTVATSQKIVTVAADGSFVAEFNVPASAAGYHTVRAQDGAGNESSAIFLTRMKGAAAPAISPNPTSGVPADIVRLAGSGFTPSSSIDLYWDGVILPAATALTAVSDGSFSAAFGIPRAAAGPHTITARSGAGEEASTSFQVQAQAATTIALSAGTGSPGDVVNITGSGFGVNRLLKLDWDGMIVLGSLATDSSGNFSGVVVVPNTAAGFHIISVTDEEYDATASTVFVIPGTAGPQGEPGPAGNPCSGGGTATTGIATAALVLAIGAFGFIALSKLKQWTIG